MEPTGQFHARGTKGMAKLRATTIDPINIAFYTFPYYAFGFVVVKVKGYQ